MFNRNIFKKEKNKEKTEGFICQSECDKIKEEKEREELQKIIESRREDREREAKVKRMLNELDKKEREKEALQRKIELQNQEEWVYVEGIKGMTKDMKGYDNFQFEVGKTYIKDGLIEICKNGFHLSLNLEDVLHHYGICKGNRFFKVRALVRKKDLDEYGTITEVDNFFYGKQKIIKNKLVSKEIEILEELSDEELFEEYKEMESGKSRWIEDIDDFKYCRKHGENKLAETKLNVKLIVLGINELLVNILTKDFDSVKSREIFVDYVEALSKENISRDMFIYLITEEQKRILRLYGSK